MPYLVNTARPSSLLIGGVDYTQNLLNWSCSDSSAYKNGLIATTGTVSLGTVPGSSLEDYDRNKFRRGDRVELSVTFPDQTTEVHPRGLLYVFGVAYSPEAESLEIEIGCRIALAALTDDATALAALPTALLDPIRKNDYQNIGAALASEGKCAYQDNSGNLQVVSFFDNDDGSTFVAGSWVSVLGSTALSVTPLAGAEPLPDGIRLSYQYPVDDIVDENDQLDQDSPNKTKIDTIESYYFTTYPATVYVRVGDGNLPGGVEDGSTPASTDSGCGNTPTRPGDNGTGSCNDNYTLEQAPLVIPAYKIQKSISEYKGPGGQLSYRYSEVRGPAIEANGQYFADKFAYCRYTWATACQPNGGCPTDGTEEILLGYTEQTNIFNQTGEVTSTITDSYSTTLSGAQPFNWRSGVVDGAPQNFTELNTSTMYRVRRVVEEFSSSQNTNVTVTTTFTSSTEAQSGISSGSIDALDGQQTKEVRTSTTITGTSVRPDTVNSPVTNTQEAVLTSPLFGSSYVIPPPEAGPYYKEESIPVPVLIEDQDLAEAYASNYLTTLGLFVKGDALGLQIGESLRKEICTGWRPGMPFRYYDGSKGRLSAMRMDATSWSVSAQESNLVTSGLWLGFSNGTVVEPSNLVGNSTPSLGGGGAPPGAGLPPSVESETQVSSGARGWEVDIFFSFQSLANTVGSGDGVISPLPTNTDITINQTFMCYVRGVMVSPGGLAGTVENGGIPISLGGDLILSSATVVDGDLFS